MQCIRYGMATLLVAGMASLAYARVPAPNAVASSADGLSGYAAAPAAQQDEPKPKAEPVPKMPRAQKPMAHPKQEKADKNQQKEDKKQDKAQAKEEQKDHKQMEGKNARIPDKDLKAHFGQSHKFTVRRVITTTRIVPNQTRFVYTGYTFVFVDPWPMGWGFDDDCYIDYVDGGYYMFDPFHPGIRVALMIAG